MDPDDPRPYQQAREAASALLFAGSVFLLLSCAGMPPPVLAAAFLMLGLGVYFALKADRLRPR